MTRSKLFYLTLAVGILVGAWSGFLADGPFGAIVCAPLGVVAGGLLATAVLKLVDVCAAWSAPRTDKPGQRG